MPDAKTMTRKTQQAIHAKNQTYTQITQTTPSSHHGSIAMVSDDEVSKFPFSKTEVTLHKIQGFGSILLLWPGKWLLVDLLHHLAEGKLTRKEKKIVITHSCLQSEALTEKSFFAPSKFKDWNSHVHLIMSLSGLYVYDSFSFYDFRQKYSFLGSDAHCVHLCFCNSLSADMDWQTMKVYLVWSYTQRRVQAQTGLHNHQNNYAPCTHQMSENWNLISGLQIKSPAH